MPAFPPLVVTSYDPNTFNYLRPEVPSQLMLNHTTTSTTSNDLPDYRSWIEVFRKSLPTFERHALQDPTWEDEEKKQAAVATFSQLFSAALDALEQRPDQPPPNHPNCHPINCINLCALRERCLQMAGLGDIFKHLKQQENAAALEHLPALLRELDSCDDPKKRMELCLRGVFAGNIFDMGAAASAARYEDGSSGGAASFASTRDALLPRPWAVDDLDVAVERLCKGRHQQVVMFVDNAGSDVVLGMLPLARELVRHGAKVVMAANEVHSINDITIQESKPLLEAAGNLDPAVIGVALSEGSLTAMSSGNDLPVIDLRNVHSDLCDLAAQKCDLVILEGMGRGIETNLLAQFRCDSLKLGMIKHPEVAALLRGRMYDCVCKWTPAVSECDQV